MCWYCGCNMKLARKYEPVASYVESLLAEIALTAQASGRRRVSHLHWGGGTPTSLEPADLSRVMQALAARYEILPDAELALEADPRTLTAEMARTLGRLGFSRASFGVQEFDPKVQTAINRIQPPEMVAEARGRPAQGGRAGGLVRPDLRPAVPDRPQPGAHRAAGRRDGARAHRAFRLRARAVDGEEPAHDPGGGAARRRRPRRPGRGRGRGAGRAGLRAGGLRPFRPAA